MRQPANNSTNLTTESILFGLLMLWSLSVFGQKQPVLRGFVKSTEDQSPLIGATVRLSTGMGDVTDVKGFFQFRLDTGRYKLTISYVGHQTKTLEIQLYEDQELNVTLKVGNQQLQEVMITGVSYKDLQEQPGQMTITAERISKLPFVFGVRDVIKALQLLPGIQVSANGSSELFVRGGGADQNLVLLDGVPIYNANHLFGFLSVFNEDVVDDATLVKSGFPARYGGRLSSILEIGVRDGSFDQFSAKASAGILSSGMMVEGPIKRDTTSFLFTARGSLLGSVGLSLWSNSLEEADSATNRFRYYFNDFNGKVTHRLNHKNTLSVSGYYGNEIFSNNRRTENNSSQSDIQKTLNWTNASGSFKWDSELSEGRTLSVGLGYSFYQLGLLTDDERLFESRLSGSVTNRQIHYDYYSGIEDWSLSASLNQSIGDHQLRYGLGLIWHKFSPGSGQIEISEGIAWNPEVEIEKTQSSIGASDIHAQEQYFFIEEEWKAAKGLIINGGIHFSGFKPGSDELGYLNFQPRFLGTYELSKQQMISFSYSRMVQYSHLLANPTVGISADLWVPSTQNVAPQKSDQLAVSFSHSIKRFKATIESYYKWMRGMIDYKDGYSLLGSAGAWESSIETGGKGTSKGFEFLLEKFNGKTTGWIAYTLSWTDRQFDGLNSGRKYPFAYDRRHALNVVFSHQLTKHMNLGLTWVYSSGNWTTIPELRYWVITNVGPYIRLKEVQSSKDRNNYQFPAYHRLDLNLNIVKPKGRFISEWNFGLYNAYSRLNPTYLYLEIDDDNTAKMRALSIFPILPSISYSLKFN